MSFALDWLDLRAPADAAARDPGLLAAAARHLAGAAAPLALDLGAGAGATARAFGSLVPGLRWRLVDRDVALLAVAARRVPGADTVAADLADLDRVSFAGVRLVTASALLDLASEPWLAALADRLAGAAVGLYAALSFDGRLAWQPPLPDDNRIAAAFNRHQCRDKGFGAALGPAAAAALAALLARRGFAVRLAPSPWRLGPADAVLARALVEGVAAAAAEAGQPSAAWRQARLAASAAGSVVGHVDLLALPVATSAQSKTTSVSSP